MDGQARARAGETQRDRATDFPAGAGDQGGAAGQAEGGEGVGHAGTPRTRSGRGYVAGSEGEGKVRVARAHPIDCLGDRAFGVDWMRKVLAEARQRSSRFDAVAPKMGAW
jgi:hypothetical protein